MDKYVNKLTFDFQTNHKILNLISQKQNININTIKKDLQYMKKEQIIQSIGKGKGTVYLINKEK